MNRKNRIGLGICALLLTIGCKEGPATEGYPEGATVEDYADTPGLERVSVYQDAILIEQGDYLNGKRDGSWVIYNPNGNIKSIESYRNGQKHGVAVYTDAQGNIGRKEQYASGVLSGDYKLYDNRKVTEEGYYEEGKLNGMLKKYYPNGAIMQETPYVKGELHGIARWYKENGDLAIAYMYENNSLVNKDALTGLDSTATSSE